MAELLLDKARDTWLSTQHSLQLAAAASVLDMLNPLFWLGLAAVGSVEAATYGNNHVTTRKDPNVLAAQFPSPNTTLLAPAFLSPETVPAAFVNGTEGPTDDAELGILPATIEHPEHVLTAFQIPSSALSPTGTNG